MSVAHHAARAGGAAAVALVAGILLAGPASAHVTISPGEGVAGSYTVATVSVAHGCDGSATTRITIKVPKELVSITPTINPDWTVTKKMQKLATPIKGEDGEITERTAQVVYTAKKPLPDGYRDAFELSFQVPDTVGRTLYFPSIQKCVKGETDWIEIAPAGQPEPEHPAPSFKVVSATADATGAVTRSGDGGSDGWGITGAIAGILGLLAGGAALVRTRGRSS